VSFSSGAVAKLNAAGVKTTYQDDTHTWISPKASRGVLLQLNPVGMGTEHQVDLGGGPAKL
jgi:hypothetical protein